MAERHRGLGLSGDGIEIDVGRFDHRQVGDDLVEHAAVWQIGRECRHDRVGERQERRRVVRSGIDRRRESTDPRESHVERSVPSGDPRESEADRSVKVVGRQERIQERDVGGHA